MFLKIKEAQAANGQFVFYRGDICNKELVEQIFSTHKPEWVLHLAARAGVRPSIEDPFVYVHSNVEGTTRLLEIASRHQCKHFVFASSSSVPYSYWFQNYHSIEYYRTLSPPHFCQSTRKDRNKSTRSVQKSFLVATSFGASFSTEFVFDGSLACVIICG